VAKSGAGAIAQALERLQSPDTNITFRKDLPMSRLPLALLLFPLTGCPADESDPYLPPASLPTTCAATQEGNQRCNGAQVQTCTAGVWQTTTNCATTGQTCQAAGTTAACVTSGTCICNVNQSACDVGCACDPLCGGAVDSPYTYCLAFATALCGRAFDDCGAELDGLASGYASEQECVQESGCVPAMDEQFEYVPAQGEACLNTVNTAACTLFEGEEPASCQGAMVEISEVYTGGCATITPGTVSGELTAADPMYNDAYADGYCVVFTSGQSVTLTVAAGAGTPVQDTILYLQDATPAIIEENDDANGLYSEITTTIPATGTYTIVVGGYDNTELGTYQLTVTLN
jgi:hypothetical protein